MALGTGHDILIMGVNYAPERSGIAPYTTGIAEGLRKRGHRVRVLTSSSLSRLGTTAWRAAHQPRRVSQPSR